MDDKKFIEYLAILLISFVFAIGSFLFKVKNKETKFTFFNGFSSVIFSLLASFIGYHVCMYFALPVNLMWIIIGLSSWGGIEFIKKVESYMTDYLKYKFRQDSGDKSKEETDNNNQ